MIEESTKKAYLNAMGVTQWQLRSSENSVEPVQAVTKTAILDVEEESVSTDVVVPKKLLVKGLKLLNQGSKNGLLVVLSEQRKDLSTESRLLMSKMLKGIHFLPNETGFAVIGEQSSSAEINLDSVKAILILGHEAGRQLVKIAATWAVQPKFVATWHPDELLINPTHKAQAWDDLKQLVNLFNSI